uniref:Uncharacterized protein n=1 Tax=Anguilla anguilla TaxID=7936 RepID=A0A0E9U960_ANGAN
MTCCNIIFCFSPNYAIILIALDYLLARQLH